MINGKTILKLAALVILGLLLGCSTASKSMQGSLDPSHDTSTPLVTDVTLDLKLVHFATNSSKLDTEAKAILKHNAEILKLHPQVVIELGGHCDNRGGVAFNFRLGEKRANAVRDFLIQEGVPLQSLNVVSYGKERPLDSDNTEAAFAQNRRVAFTVLAA